MRKDNGKVHIVNLSNYNSPEIKENTRHNWVEYGEDNNYYQYIIDCYTGSPTNNASINGIIQMIYGEGLDATDSSRKTEQYAEMKKLLKPECVYNCANDLKLLGAYAMQVVYSKQRKIVEIEHIPVETLRPEKCNEDGEIEAYYYFHDWSKLRPKDEPKRIPAFGTSKEGLEILFMKPYKSGFYYFAPVDYQGGLQYAELEEEISNYHINNIKNGLAPSMLINFNNGVPSEEDRRKTVNDINKKYQGSSNAGKIIVGFNKNKENSATIEAIQLSDAHNQYQFLSDEAMRKIMVAHRIVSPMLLGIKDSTGLGNNADELKTASILMDNTVIKPFQNLLIEGFNKILNHNDIVLNLYFKTLQPLEFVDMGDNIVDEETREEETGVKLSADDLFSEFGEDEDLENWELIDERPVDYDKEEELDREIEGKNNPKKSLLSKVWNFVSTGVARTNAKSEQDGEADGYKYKVRYQYAPLRTSENSRDFCKKMVQAKKIYRKEDIEAMSKKAVNAGWGLNGADTYDIWLYKGGGDCHHFWMRKTYRAKSTTPDAKNPRSEVSVNEARKDGFKPEKNDRKVAQRPKDMPNNGFVNKRR